MQVKYLNNENTPTLYTQRLILRKFELKDLEDVSALYSDEEVNKFLPWFPHRTKQESERYLTEVLMAEYDKVQAYCYVIALKEDNIVIGFAIIHDIEYELLGASLGYALKKEFWNQGIVTEACSEVISHLRKSGFRYLTATHDINNVGSGEVMKKLGMKYCYSYEEQWQPKDIKVVFRMYQINFDEKLDRVYKGYWWKYPNHFVEDIK